jgi:hypothetical protein
MTFSPLLPVTIQAATVAGRTEVSPTDQPDRQSRSCDSSTVGKEGRENTCNPNLSRRRMFGVLLLLVGRCWARPNNNVGLAAAL